MTIPTAPRFCFACGTPLPAGARFCPQCGQSLAPAPTEPPAADGAPGTSAGPASDAAPALAPGERRQVTVLFADLVDFTRLSSQRDPEDVHRLLGRYFESVDAIVDRYGGRIDKHIGDAVMGVFGAPVAHGNDAERAVRAATDIHQAMERLSEDSGQPLQAHVGIASGEVVAAGTGSAAHTEYTVTGDAVNVASRLESLAGRGETLVSGAVWAAVASRFAGQAAGRIAVRGRDAPVEVWRITGERDPNAEQLPLFGRRNEIGQLAAVLDVTVESGHGQMVLLRGDAGIGKTRLTEQFREMAEQRGFECHKGLVLDFGVGRGRGAIAAIAARLLGAAGDAEAERERALGQALESGQARREDEAFLRDLIELAQPERSARGYALMDESTRARGRLQAMHALCERAARARPRLLTVEDVHWADAFTLECLAALARASGGHPIIVLATTRIDGDPIDAGWRARTGAVPLLTLDLGPLAEADAIRLASAVANASDGVVRSCVERAEGNPLFIVQLLHAAEENTALPASIQSLMLSRIDRLEPRDKAAIQAAAVIGQRFALPLLQALTGEHEYACGPLIEHHLVRPEGDEYLFAHALICDGAYASLLHSRKRELHLRAAEWYGARDPVLHAQHLDRAGDARAAAAYIEAGRALAGGRRLDAALAMTERAQALAPDDAGRFAAAMLRGELLNDLGRTPASIEAYEEAALAAPDDAARCRALIGVAGGQRQSGAPDRALAALARAEPLARALGLTLERSIIHHTRGNLHFARGEVSDCLAEHARALAAAREAEDALAEAHALSGLGDARYAQGRMRSALERFGECVQLARRHGLLRVEVANLCMMGHSCSFIGELDSALAHVRAGADIAKELRQPYLDMFVLESLAMIHLHRGERDDAATHAHEGLARARALESRRYESILMMILATLAVAAGRTEEARAQLVDALAIVRERGVEGFIGAPMRALLARTVDDPVEASRLLDEGEGILAQGAVGHSHLWFHRDATDTAIAWRDWTRALHHCAALETFSADEPLPWTALHAARGRALAAWAQGRRDPATLAELRRIRDEAARRAMGSVLPSIDQALASTDAEA